MPTESGASFIERYQQKLAEGNMENMVTVELSSARGGLVSLDRIKSHHLGRGYAKWALATLILLADELEYEIRLVPHPLDEMTNKERLVKWYEAYGFIHAEGAENAAETMARPARRKENTEEIGG